MVITVYMYILRASWKISYYMYTRIYVCAKCCHPHKIKSLLTYLLSVPVKNENETKTKAAEVFLAWTSLPPALTEPTLKPEVEKLAK